MLICTEHLRLVAGRAFPVASGALLFQHCWVNSPEKENVGGSQQKKPKRSAFCFSCLAGRWTGEPGKQQGGQGTPCPGAVWVPPPAMLAGGWKASYGGAVGRKKIPCLCVYHELAFYWDLFICTGAGWGEQYEVCLGRSLNTYLHWYKCMQNYTVEIWIKLRYVY